MAASGGLLTGRTVLLAKIEATYGTDPTPATSANEVEVFGLTIKPGYSKVERKPLRASISPLSSFKSRLTWECTFETELKGSGTAGTAGRLSPLFRSCGTVETVTGGVSVVYKPGNPSGAGVSSCTLYIYKDGLLFKMKGARGTFEIVAEAGKIPMVKWTFKSIYTVPTDVSLPSPTYESTIGQLNESISMQVSGFAGYTRSYSLNIANTVIERPSLNAANALLGVLVAARQPVGKMLMEAETIATEPTWTEFDADTLVDFTVTHGGTAGNIVTITGTGKCQYETIEPSDESGIFMYDISLMFSGTDDEFTITMT